MLRRMHSHMCRWVSTKPGITTVLVASTTSASPASRFGPTAAIFEPSMRTSAWVKLPIAGSIERTVPPRRTVLAIGSLSSVGSVGSQGPYDVGQFVDGRDHLLFEVVGERQRDVRSGDAFDRRIEQLEAFIRDDGYDGGSPAALVRIFLYDYELGGAFEGREHGTHVQRYEAAQIHDLDRDVLCRQLVGGGQRYRYRRSQRDNRDVGALPDHRGLAQLHDVALRWP